MFALLVLFSCGERVWEVKGHKRDNAKTKYAFLSMWDQCMVWNESSLSGHYLPSLIPPSFTFTSHCLCIRFTVGHCGRGIRCQGHEVVPEPLSGWDQLKKSNPGETRLVFDQTVKVTRPSLSVPVETGNDGE
ncbi:hypothetical protein K457DRAFT_120654 [Linnemannia elongata AG-77]|uniref:C3H1-type domain-containing protein n=1 Tax=Linnemannia elongata AG-77 TaxID=1314771 RepID=A0A197KHS1_9FUNG|nr:hypothetical protein K457DRAFT_120654 [Linnemannia elongata AG-77]